MKTAEWTSRLPWTVVGVALALAGVGMLGIWRAEQLGLASDRLLPRQAVWAVLALAAMLSVTTVNYRALCRWSYPAFIASIALLVVVYFFPPINGARRWIRLGPIGFQPSELAKLAFVLALARWLMYRDNYQRMPGLVAPLVIALAPVLLILREPDLGTAAVFLPVLFIMLFVAGARKRHLALLLLVAVMVSPLLWSQMSREQRSRVTALFEQNPPHVRPSPDGYHLHQAKQMFALGGGAGSFFAGDAVDDPGAYFVPEAPTDSILAVLGERFGLLGVVVLLLMYSLLVWRGLAIAAATREPFGRLLAVGLVSLVAVQVLINAAMMLGLVPITGLSLPLVSYGGTGLLVQGLAIGLLLNVGLRPGYEVTNEPFRFTGQS